MNDAYRAREESQESKSIDPQRVPIETDSTTGAEGGGARVGYGANTSREFTPGFENTNSPPDRQKAASSGDRSRYGEESAFRFIPSMVHGVLDYLVGILLVASPWLFEFASESPAAIVPMVLGLGTILYSLATDYELGLFSLLSMRAHLGLDILAGILLAASPWIFGFADVIWIPHVLIGAMEVAVALLTNPTPSAAYPRGAGPVSVR